MYRNQRSFSNSRGNGNSRSYGNSGFGGRRFSGGQRNARKVSMFDPSMLVRQASEQAAPAPEYVPVNKFTDFPIHPGITQNILGRGYNNPTPIQDQAIAHVLQGRDVVGIANTGTGKTAAFLIPLINKVVANNRSKVLVMVPTRELAIQVAVELKEFGRGMRVYSTLCIGGESIYRQIQDLSRNPSFVIGTPGRLVDLHQRGRINFADFDTIVLDEVDRMLDMGFINDVKMITSQLAEERQSLFFSATMSNKVQDVMRGFLKDPITVVIKSINTSERVNQDVVKLDGRAKIEVLHDLLIQEGFEKVLVFGRTKHGVESLSRQLIDRGFAAASIHGNKSLGQRKRALSQFKNSQIQVLLATDVVARGVDIDNVTHVINYDLPETYEDYIHRIGRTGRADKTGTALTLIN